MFAFFGWLLQHIDLTLLMGHRYLSPSFIIASNKKIQAVCQSQTKKNAARIAPSFSHPHSNVHMILRFFCKIDVKFAQIWEIFF